MIDWASSSILVTGGTGFFGQGFARAALALGSPRVCIYSRSEYQQFLMRKSFSDDLRLRFFIGDVRDQDRLRRAMHGVDVVIHAAALKRVEVAEYDASEVVKTNVMGTMNVIEAATDAHVARVVSLSSDKACAPVNCYGASKLLGEKLILAANNSRGLLGPRFACVRYGNVAGSTGSVIPIWRKALEQDQEVELTDPYATRFWMTLAQACELVRITADTMHGGELNIPTLPAYKLGDLALAMGVKYRITGLGPGEKIHESMIEGKSSLEARRMDVDELREALRHV